eukprot:3879176-Lingulodinium_polyedra.AAC.1
MGNARTQLLAGAGKHIQPPLIWDPLSLEAIAGGPLDFRNVALAAPCLTNRSARSISNESLSPDTMATSVSKCISPTQR